MSSAGSWTYRSSDGSTKTLTDALLSSSVYLVLATANYLSDVEHGDARVTKEISMMKALKKNVLLVWVVNPGRFGVELDEASRDKVRGYCCNCCMPSHERGRISKRILLYQQEISVSSWALADGFGETSSNSWWS